MLESAVHESHDRAVRKILQDNGCLDSHGLYRAWKGPIIIPALLAAGHSTVEFETCTCRKQITKTIAQEWAEHSRRLP
jgi:hypothetical protein